MGLRSWRQGAGVLAAFVAVALLQAWPLPLHLSTRLTGVPNGDAGVYVWNMWVFRHELITEGGSPFWTSRIFSLGAPADLSLHNYTTVANLVALPLQPLLGLVATFNVVYLFNVVLAGAGMFLLARRVTGRVAESWLAGMLFACSPFLVTRGAIHFSLVAAAPLPIFLWFLLRVWESQRLGDAVGTGLTLAWAAFSDPYYGIYCVMTGVAFVVGRVLIIHSAHVRAPDARHLTRLLDVAIVTLVVLVVSVYVVGRGVVRLGPIVVSMRTLYTPMFLLTTLGVLRALVVRRPQFTIGPLPPLLPLARSAAAAAIVAAILLSPVLFAVGRRMAEGRMVATPVLWRSSAPGIDLLSLAVPNPNHPLMPQGVVDWLSSRPSGYHENVGSLSLVALAVILVAWRRARWRPSRLWLAITVAFGVMSLGPFVHVAGLNTFVPTPWTLLRYVPLVGEARMPSRFAIVAMLGLCVLFAAALSALANRYPQRRRLVLATVGLALAFELLAAPRTLYSAEIPSVYHTIAADPRPIRVLQLPFGVRDGLSSLGNFSAGSQYYQTLHGKALIGGYLSRVSTARKESFRRLPVRGALITLSEGRPLTPVQARRARAGADEFLNNARLGYVVIDRTRASPDLVAFATEIFGLERIESSGPLDLYVPDDPRVGR